LKNGIRKGIPSLFISLKFIYKDAAKVKILQDTGLSFVSSLSSKKFPNSSNIRIVTYNNIPAQIEAPDAILWTKFFLSQHYDVIGDSKNALLYIDEAIAHTPTVIELYVIKAKIYKHAGDLDQCSQFLEKARDMDLADRYLNNRSSKYLLRTNQVEKTISTLGLFTKVIIGDSQWRYL
jgi:tetratricopeptide (TPR) repeat protein